MVLEPQSPVPGTALWSETLASGEWPFAVYGAPDEESPGWGTGAFAAVERSLMVLQPRSGANKLEESFALQVGGRWLRLSELRSVLIHGRQPRTLKDAVWREVIDRVQSDGQRWSGAALWLALPGLRRRAGLLRRQLGPAATAGEDVDSELVVAFLDCLLSFGPSEGDRPNVYARLLHASTRRAEAAVDLDVVGLGRRMGHLNGEDVPAQQGPGGGNPELVLRRAVEAGVIEDQDAELIARTRLEREPLGCEARRAGVTADRMSVRRRRAERILVEALRRDAF